MKIASLLFILFFSVLAEADVTSRYFRHLSLILRGRSPSEAEWIEFGKVSDQKKRNFLLHAAERFYDTEHVKENLRLYYHQRFGVPYIQDDFETILWPEHFSLSVANGKVPQVNRLRSIGRIIETVVDKNLTWRDLHTSSPAPTKDLNQEEFEFFQELGQKSLSGVYSTPEFFNKFYWSSEFGDTVRRSAVVKDLLCMNINAPTEKNSDWFVGNELRPTSVNANLALSFGGRTVNAATFGDMILKITKFPEYSECQIRSLSDFLVSSEEPLSRDSLTFLLATFRNGGVEIRQLIVAVLMRGFDDFAKLVDAESRHLRMADPKQFLRVIKNDFSLNSENLAACRLLPEDADAVTQFAPWTPRRFDVISKCVLKAFEGSQVLADFFPTEEAWNKSLPSERRETMQKLVTRVLGPSTASASKVDKICEHLVLVMDKGSPNWQRRRLEAIRDLVMTEEYRRL